MRNAPGSPSRSGRFLALLLACCAVLATGLVACRSPADTTAPTIEPTGIADGALVSADEITVLLAVRDDRGVASVSYVTDHGAGGACQLVEEPTFACGPIPLSEGDTLITFLAVDRAGNAAATALRLQRPPASDATPPELALSGIADGETVSVDAIAFTAVAHDDGGIASVGYRTDHGSSGACSHRVDDDYDCGPVPLPFGDTVVKVAAQDVAGNETERSVTLHRVPPPELPPDTTPPSLVVSGLGDGDVVTISEVHLTATSRDDRSIPSVAFETSHGAAGSCARTTVDGYHCGPIPVPLGESAITVTARDAAGNASSVSMTVRREDVPIEPGFDIEVVFYGKSFEPSQRAAFEAAVARWEELVVGDLEDVTVDLPADGSCGFGEPAYAGTIDDLVIFATGFTDGAGGLLGSAGPCLYRSSGADPGTSLVGMMRFDTLDLASLEAGGDLVEVIVHEMAHVLGFGTNWELPPYFDVLDYVPLGAATSCRTATAFVRGPDYVGGEGIAAWIDLGGMGALPVEESGGPGTRCGHWDEETFGDELMTGYLEPGAFNPLSALSIRSLQDIGLTVDASKADPYTLPSFPALRTADAFDLASAEQLLLPRGGVDTTTGKIEVRFGGTP